MLSSLNTRIFFLICGFVFVCGPTTWILSIGVEGMGVYLGNFIEKSLFTGAASGDQWPQWWTIFYWANWLAWAPITALFLGKISRGYTVREFLVINMMLPALFACVWMSIFSGTALSMDMNGDGLLNKALQATGAESVVYAMLDNLPLAGITAAVFIFVSFLSYVTAADSNTEAMSNLCSEDCEASLSGDTQAHGASLKLKLIWGGTIGFVAWVMTSFAGVDGIKMMSNLGGLPALVIVLGCNVALIHCLLSGHFQSPGGVRLGDVRAA
jgi:choline-glycine betaine transporter